ncbi:MAG: tetratricopeptide repeat protein [bacterium]
MKTVRNWQLAVGSWQLAVGSRQLAVRSLLLASGFWLLAFTLFAQDPTAALIKANKAYTDGLYNDAAELYKQVADAGYQAPELFFNLGNCYYKLDDFPNAILWYERARRLDPGNENIDFNLNVTNSKIADKIDALPELFYVRWFKALVNLYPVKLWSYQTIIFFILTLASISLYLLGVRLILRKAGFWTGFLFFTLTLFTLLFSLSGTHQMKNLREAIVFDPTVTVKSSPDEKSIDLFVLHEGTKVRVLDKIGTWYEIRIANGSVGWLPGEALVEI